MASNASDLRWEGRSGTYRPTLGRLQSLWDDTTDLKIPQDELAGNELRTYFTGTLLSMIREICELDRLSTERPTREFAERFKDVQPHLMGQLRLMSEIGMAIWPSDRETFSQIVSGESGRE